MRKDNIYHAINVNEDYYSQAETLEKLEKILESGELLSRRLRGDLDKDKGGFSGFDYISFYDNLLRNYRCYGGNKFYKGYDSYNTYIINSLTLGFKRDNVCIIKPTLIRPVIFDWGSLEEMRVLGRVEGTRYTDMPDEVQVKDRLSLKKLDCLTLPVSLMVDNSEGVIYDSDGIYKCVNEIAELLGDYDYKVPIYDLESRMKLDTYQKVVKVFEKYKKL